MLVIGAGDVGQRMAVALAGAGVGEIVVANRTHERAPRPRRAGRWPGHRRSTSIPDVLAGPTCVLVVHRRASTCSSSGPTIEDAMRRRDDRAMLVVDIAVPRDVDPGVAQVFGVTLLDIDDLRALGEQSLQQRRAEIGQVREIIADELERYRIERSAREVAPLVTALRARAEELRVAELERLAGELDRRPRRAGDASTRSPAGSSTSCCTSPTVRLKDAAGTARGDRLRRRVGAFARGSSEPARRPTRRRVMPAPAARGATRWQRRWPAGRPSG